MIFTKLKKNAFKDFRYASGVFLLLDDEATSDWAWPNTDLQIATCRLAENSNSTRSTWRVKRLSNYQQQENSG